MRTCPARRVEGPWGAFAVVDVAVSERLRAILYAPWEGRLDPTPAEIDAADAGRAARRDGTRPLAALRAGPQPGRRAQPACRGAGRLPAWRHPRPPDAADEHRRPGHRAARRRARSERRRADLESITHQAERLRRMVSQLLVASRLEAGVLTPQQEVFAVPPLVERTWAALRADRPFELSVDGPPHLAVADPDRLEQVLWALLDNAVKYSPAGSPIASASRPDGTGWRSPSATRAGMDDGDAWARVRAVLSGATQARKLAPDGSGVGLYAARGLMRGDGRHDRRSTAAGRRHRGHAARAGRAQRRRRGVGRPYRRWSGAGIGHPAR